MSTPRAPRDRHAGIDSRGAVGAARRFRSVRAARTNAGPGEEDQPSTWQLGLYLKIGLLLFAIGYAIAFVVQNTQQIRIDFVFSTANVRLIWEILLLLGSGLVGGVLLSQLYRHRRRERLAKKSGKPSDARADIGRPRRSCRQAALSCRRPGRAGRSRCLART